MGNNQNENEESNVYRFVKKRKFNILPVLFICIFVYVIIVAIIYLRTTHTVRYEVKEGSLASSTIYKAIALRNEKVISNNYAGYVNFLAREGQRVAVGDLIYTVDETGNLSDYLEAQSQGENSLSDKELSDFRTDIINYVHEYDSEEFSSVYSFKYNLKNTVLKLANTKLLNSMDEATSNAGGISLKYVYSGNSGIVSYWFDGYEDYIAEQISKDDFNEKNYEKKLLLSNELRAIDEPIYKISSSENWSIVIPVNKATAQKLLEEDYVKVKFLKNQNESWGKVSILENADGTYAELTFTNSMISFTSERFLDVELELGNEVGLKIPISSIAEKEFYLIEDDFVTETSAGSYNVLMQVYNEDGSKTVSSIPINIYSYDEARGVYYVDASVVNAGDILFGNNENTFVVRDRGSLIGVYNINKGYADFKEISILYQNDEYAIVRSNTSYGLRVYDYIALDAKSVSDDQFISQKK